MQLEAGQIGHPGERRRVAWNDLFRGAAGRKLQRDAFDPACRADVAPCGVPVGEDDFEAPRERVSEVPVSHDGVELAEFAFVVDRGPGDRPDDEFEITGCSR